MSQTGLAESLFGGLPADIKRVLTEFSRYVIPNNKFGPIDHQTKSENFQGYYANSTTPASTSEFTVQHGMGRAPYLALMALDLSAVGARTPVLTVSRAADAQRVYLKADAGSTSSPFTIYLE